MNRRSMTRRRFRLLGVDQPFSLIERGPGRRWWAVWSDRNGALVELWVPGLHRRM